jgi:hypothetical protein
MWKQTKYSLASEIDKKMLYMHKIEYYSTLKRKEILE